MGGREYGSKKWSWGYHNWSAFRPAMAKEPCRILDDVSPEETENRCCKITTSLNDACWEGCSQKEHSVRGGLYEVTGFARAVEVVIRADRQLFFLSMLEVIGSVCEHCTSDL